MTIAEASDTFSSLGDILKKRHMLLQAIRRFFCGRGYIEADTAHLMRMPPPDPQIDPLAVCIDKRGPFYLHTSPEMGMKKLLPAGHKRLFQICKVFRTEDHEEVHNTEFTMLEWYREGTYRDTLAETEHLVRAVARDFSVIGTDPFAGPFPVFSIEGLFMEHFGFNPFLLDRGGFFDALTRKGFIGIDGLDDWNNLFFKAFIQDVEPALPKDGPYFIIDWPGTISTMAKQKEGEPGKVERFELYMEGLEIANGYTELLDPVLQRERFVKDNEERKRLGKAVFDIDEVFLDALSKLSGSYSGVSIGVDRLFMALLGKKEIADVTPYRFTL